MNTTVNKPKMHLLVKIILILIPIAIFGYLITVNFIIDQEFNYFYDIGTSDENYLSPTMRISEPIENNYRNLSSQLVYFDVPISQGAETIDVDVRFQNLFEEDQKFLLGARDQEEWHYKWNELIINSANGVWSISKTSFNISEVYLQKGKLSFSFNIAHLKQNKTESYQIPIDWINITVYKPGVFS